MKGVTSSAIIDHFALGTDQFIADMLRQEVGRRIKKESDFTEIFSLATAPVRQSFISKAELALIRIARTARSSKDLARRIALHQQRYFWIHNNYFAARELSVRYFTAEVHSLRRSSVDLKTKEKKLALTPSNNARRKATILRTYRLSRHLRTLLKTSEDFTWWQDERKRATFLNIHIGTKLLGEVARRRGYPFELMKYLVPPEMATVFVKDVPSLTDLHRRQRGCGIVVWRGGHYIATGKDAGVLRRLMFTTKKRDHVRDVRGLSASVGRAVGRARVIQSARDVGKVKTGDIIIAVMTRPDYIVGLKKAAAIVTNEGGITCHAAIVARELGIPCIIGTKIATEVFKDGDLVEVNANHGVVTRLKR